MESTQQLIVNQTERSLLVRVLAAILFTSIFFLAFLVYYITFELDYDLGKERDFIKWVKGLKGILVAGIFAFGIAFYLAKRKRIIFENAGKKYKIEYYIGPFYWGSWTNYEELKMIGIFKNPKQIYEPNIWFTNSRHIEFDNFYSHKDALAEANYLAEHLKLQIWDSSDPKNPHFIE